MVKFLFTINRTLKYKDISNLLKGVQLQGGLRMCNHQLLFKIYNVNPQLLHLGSKVHFCGVLLPNNQSVIIQDINAIKKPCKQWIIKGVKNRAIQS